MMNRRLEEYRLKKRYKVKQFATLIRINQGSYSNIKNGKTKPSAETIEKVVRYTDINAHWLTTGEGPMIREEAPPIELEGPHEVSDQATIYTITRCAADPDCQKICETYVQAAHQDTKEMLAAVAEIMRSGNEEVITSLKYNLITFRKAVKNDELVKSFLRRGRTKGTGKKET